MAKHRKGKCSKHYQPSKAVGLRSDIPLAHRMLMQQYLTIAEQRDDAASTALKLACVALNNSEGLGYTRLARFAEAFQQVCDEYYGEPDRAVSDSHLDERLEKMGFVVRDGKVYTTYDDEGKIAPKSFLEAKLAAVEEAEKHE